MTLKKIQLPLVMGIVEREGMVLLARRHEPSLKTIHNKWEFPGGKIEFGEDPLKACEREVLEETGVVVEASEMLPFPYAAVRKYRKFNLQALILCFVCEYKHTISNFNRPNKVSEITWSNINEIDPVQLQSGSLHFLHYILQTKRSEIKIQQQGKFIHYISLESIEEDTNRFRQYGILIESNILDDIPFKIQCTWGRLEQNSKATEEHIFKHRDEMLNYLNTKLLRRRYHDYRIVDISYAFPFVPALERFDHNKKHIVKRQIQLNLFPNTKD